MPLGQSPLILLIDNELLIVALLQDVLSDAGFETIVAASGAAAIDFLTVHHCAEHDGRCSPPCGPLCGVISDIDLGAGPNGWQVARHARELIPAVPVVYMSGASADAWSANGVPGSVMLRKPFMPGDLIAAVGRLLAA